MKSIHRHRFLNSLQKNYSWISNSRRHINYFGIGTRKIKNNSGIVSVKQKMICSHYWNNQMLQIHCCRNTAGGQQHLISSLISLPLGIFRKWGLCVIQINRINLILLSRMYCGEWQVPEEVSGLQQVGRRENAENFHRLRENKEIEMTSFLLNF